MIGSTDVFGARVAILTTIICQAATGSRVVIAELAGATFNGADVDDTVFPFAGWRNCREVHLAGGTGHRIEAISAVKILLTTAAGDGHPFTLSVFAVIQGTRVAVIADKLRSLWSAALGANGRMPTGPVDAFVYGAADPVVALQRALAASWSSQNLVFTFVLDAGP